MINETLRDKIAAEAMAALLSNPHFSQHMLKALSYKDILKKDDTFFKVMAAYGCRAADELIARLKK